MEFVLITMAVQGYLEAIGLVPDHKNNRRLLVIDLSQSVHLISHSASGDPVQLLS